MNCLCNISEIKNKYFYYFVNNKRMERYSKMGKFVERRNLLGVPTIEEPRSFDVLEKALTGQRDPDLLILSNLDDETLLSFCLANRSANLLCQNESFWRNRFINKYGLPPFTVSNWRRLYLKSIWYLNKIVIDYDVLYNLAKDSEYEMINLMIFLDHFKTPELSSFHFLMGIKGAVEVDNREMINFLMGMKKFNELDFNSMLGFAVIVDNKDLIDFFIASGAKNLTLALYEAIKSKNLDVVEYITNKIPSYSLTTEWLNEYLKYSFKNGTQEISGYFLDLIQKNEDELNRQIQKKRRNARSRK